MTKPHFLKKLSFRPDGHGRAQNGPKIGFFGLFSKSARLFFLIFCTKLEGMVGHKMAQAVFSRKFLFVTTFAKRGLTRFFEVFFFKKTPFFIKKTPFFIKKTLFKLK